MSNYYPYIRLTATDKNIVYVQALDVVAVQQYEDGSWLRLNGGHNLTVLERPEEILQLILEVDNGEDEEEEEDWR